jgi:NitT/TauT family transport system substrate-binding protein
MCSAPACGSISSRRTARRRADRRPAPYFNQDPKIIRFVMQNPTDRVTYGDLRMIRSEFEELMQLSMQAGTIKHPIPYEKYVDERFARAQSPRVIPL